MTESLILTDYSQYFYFGFRGPNGMPVSLDPQFGEFQLNRYDIVMDGEFTGIESMAFKTINVGVKEINLAQDDQKGNFDVYPQDTKGFY